MLYIQFKAKRTKAEHSNKLFIYRRVKESREYLDEVSSGKVRKESEYKTTSNQTWKLFRSKKHLEIQRTLTLFAAFRLAENNHILIRVIYPILLYKTHTVN